MAHKVMKNGLIVLRTKSKGRGIPEGHIRVKVVTPGSTEPTWMLIRKEDYVYDLVASLNPSKDTENVQRKLRD